MSYILKEAGYEQRNPQRFSQSPKKDSLGAAYSPSSLPLRCRHDSGTSHLGSFAHRQSCVYRQSQCLLVRSTPEQQRTQQLLFHPHPDQDKEDKGE